MAPMEYAELAVLPTIREFTKRPGDRRLAYLPVITMFHILGYLKQILPRASQNRRENNLRKAVPDAFALIKDQRKRFEGVGGLALSRVIVTRRFGAI